MSKYKDVTDLKEVFKCGKNDGDNIQVKNTFQKEFTAAQNQKIYVTFNKDDWYKVINCFYDETYKTNSIHLQKIGNIRSILLVFDFKLENGTLDKSLDEFFKHFTKPERHTYTLGQANEEEDAVADPVDPVIFQTVDEANASGPDGGKKRKTRRKPLKRKSRKTIRRKRKTLRKRK